MRVLDPKVRNPVYKFHDKTTRAIGDFGHLALIGGVGVVAPVGAGLFVEAIYAALSAIGFYGYLTYSGYKGKTKNKSRVTTLVNISQQIPESDRAAIDPLIAEVFHCPVQHYEFYTGDRGIRHETVIDRGISRNQIRFVESEKAWIEREKREKILKLGYGCMYCGERIQTAIELRDECAKRFEDNDEALQHARSILEAKRQTNEIMSEFHAGTRAIAKELMR